MAEIINLNRARKARVRGEKEAQAERNRAAFGRTRAEKEAARKAADKERRNLDGKKIED